MADGYVNFINGPIGSRLANQLGLPKPADLRRYKAGAPLLPGPALIGSATGGPVSDLAQILKTLGVDVITSSAVNDTDKFGGMVLDARDLASPADLDGLRTFFAGRLRQLRGNGRIVVLGRSTDGKDAETDAARYALTGFVRSLAKELKGGSTANLLYVNDEASLVGSLVFFLGGRSAYVDGQILELGPVSENLTGSLGDRVEQIAGKMSGKKGAPADVDFDKPLAGKVAVVTGAARGIGAAIAAVLARDGAQVVCADLAAMADELAATAEKVGGVSLAVDVTAEDAGEKLHRFVETHFKSGIDVLVHNAGITRDKLMANMKEAQWASVMAVNIQSQLRINSYLLGQEFALNPGARIVTLASIAGIAGNRGQTNYGASKAAVIGMARSLAPKLAERNATINVIAPGFIETDMTAKIPFATREVGRRLSSLQQGGLPIDVAETVSFLSWPTSGGISGQVLRVCGQNLIGA